MPPMGYRVKGLNKIYFYFDHKLDIQKFGGILDTSSHLHQDTLCATSTSHMRNDFQQISERKLPILKK